MLFFTTSGKSYALKSSFSSKDLPGAYRRYSSVERTEKGKNKDKEEGGGGGYQEQDELGFIRALWKTWQFWLILNVQMRSGPVTGVLPELASL